jgi:uncharacterized protein (TIGR00251 family)
MTANPSDPPRLAARVHSDGVSFEVVVVPRASRSRIVGLHGRALKVTLAAAPVDGEANAELCAALAKVLRVAKRAVSIVAGEHAKTKTVQVRGVSLEDVEALTRGVNP